MIEFKNGDLLKESVDALVNTVNCVGVMGKGIALQFKNAFPENFRAYADACKAKSIVPGKIFVFKTGSLMPPRYIVNFPTKNHWREQSRLEDIKAGLEDLCAWALNAQVKSIALPPLGCGLGGLSWPTVKEAMISALAPLVNTNIIIFSPNGAPMPAQMIHAGPMPRMTPGIAALLCLMREYIQGLLDPFISLLEIHKLMYFLQCCGEPLKLAFDRAPHGPYAINLRHLLNRIESFYISGYGDGIDAPGKPILLVDGAVAKADMELSSCLPTKNRVDKVLRLVEGYESPFGLELLASAHWVANNESVESINDLITHIYSWDISKNKFSRRQIEHAACHLADYGWIRELGH